MLTESSKGRIVIKENSLFDNSVPAFDQSKKESHLSVMSVMMADIITETTMAKMERKINLLMNVVKE